MDFKVITETNRLGKSKMNDRAEEFCQALKAQLSSTAIGIVVCSAFIADDEIRIEFCNAPEGQRRGVNFDNNRFACNLEGFSKDGKIKLEVSVGYFSSKVKAPRLRGKTAREELVIKHLANHINELSQIEPSLQSEIGVIK